MIGVDKAATGFNVVFTKEYVEEGAVEQEGVASVL